MAQLKLEQLNVSENTVSKSVSGNPVPAQRPASQIPANVPQTGSYGGNAVNNMQYRQHLQAQSPNSSYNYQSPASYPQQSADNNTAASPRSLFGDDDAEKPENSVRF